MSSLVRFVNRMPNILRWGLLLPCSIAIPILFRMIFWPIIKGTIYYGAGADENSFIYALADFLYDGPMTAFILMQVAYIMAPSRKRVATICMAIFAAAFQIFWLFYNPASWTGPIIRGIIGYIASVVYVTCKLINDPEALEIKEKN